MDTIDVSNLNRQFLFRKHDVGSPKAVVAADFVMKRVPGVKVKAHVARIESFPSSFYRGFNLVVAGLDSVEARRWLNSMLVSLVELDDDGDIVGSSVIPLIDGGTEGFKGHARLIIPKVSACFECTVGLFPPQVTFPLCTIQVTPRLPEHCVAWAVTLEWARVFGDKVPDWDDPDNIRWVYERALERAKENNISGVTYFLAQGVVKNIIPAIASTNAIIAAACANEAVKAATALGKYINNYMMYQGADGIYTHTYECEKLDDCFVCGTKHVAYAFAASQTLQELYDRLLAETVVTLKAPSLRGDEACKVKSLYMLGPLEAQTRPNLARTLGDLLGKKKSVISVTDKAMPASSLEVTVTLEDLMEQ
jgi:ubiquitin-activating enzyme E1 C